MRRWLSITCYKVGASAGSSPAPGAKNMPKTIDIDANMPHKVSEVICVKCGSRWLAVRPIVCKLKDLVCKQCGRGYVIETGEVIEQN